MRRRKKRREEGVRKGVKGGKRKEGVKEGRSMINKGKVRRGREEGSERITEKA